jgi:hypothetical protein
VEIQVAILKSFSRLLAVVDSSLLELKNRHQTRLGWDPRDRHEVSSLTYTNSIIHNDRRWEIFLGVLTRRMVPEIQRGHSSASPILRCPQGRTRL